MLEQREIKELVEWDRFMDLPKESQLLYFHLLFHSYREGEGEDEVYVAYNAKSLAKSIGVNGDYLLVLEKANFISQRGYLGCEIAVCQEDVWVNDGYDETR